MLKIQKRRLRSNYGFFSREVTLAALRGKRKGELQRYREASKGFWRRGKRGSERLRRRGAFVSNLDCETGERVERRRSRSLLLQGSPLGRSEAGVSLEIPCLPLKGSRLFFVCRV